MTSYGSSYLAALCLSDGADYRSPSRFSNALAGGEFASDSRRDFNPPQFGPDTPAAVGASNLSRLPPKRRLSRSNRIRPAFLSGSFDEQNGVPYYFTRSRKVRFRFLELTAHFVHSFFVKSHS
jgi:hypothetical protein